MARPPRKHRTAYGSLTLRELARTRGMPLATLKTRLHRGMSLDQALARPVLSRAEAALTASRRSRWRRE